MPDDSSRLPARSLDRAALERVLARAAELQGTNPDAGEPGLSEQQIVEVAREVGISEEHVRLALAEERTGTRVPAAAQERGLAARLAGPAVVSASRTIHGAPAQVLAALDEWMRREECLQVRRRFPDRVVWEPRRDLVGNIRRGFNIGGRGYVLSRAQEVGGSVVAVDAQRVLVRLDADLSPQRSNRLGGAMAAGGLGAAMSAVGLVAVITVAPVGAFAALAAAGSLLPALAGGAAGLGVARGYRKIAERTQLAMEQVIDRLEHQEASLAPRTTNPLLEVIEGVRRLRP